MTQICVTYHMTVTEIRSVVTLGGSSEAETTFYRTGDESRTGKLTTMQYVASQTQHTPHSYKVRGISKRLFSVAREQKTDFQEVLARIQIETKTRRIHVT